MSRYESMTDEQCCAEGYHRRKDREACACGYKEGHPHTPTSEEYMQTWREKGQPVRGSRVTVMGKLASVSVKDGTPFIVVECEVTPERAKETMSLLVEGSDGISVEVSLPTAVQQAPASISTGQKPELDKVGAKIERPRDGRVRIITFGSAESGKDELVEVDEVWLRAALEGSEGLTEIDWTAKAQLVADCMTDEEPNRVGVARKALLYAFREGLKARTSKEAVERAYNLGRQEGAALKDRLWQALDSWSSWFIEKRERTLRRPLGQETVQLQERALFNAFVTDKAIKGGGDHG